MRELNLEVSDQMYILKRSCVPTTCWSLWSDQFLQTPMSEPYVENGFERSNTRGQRTSRAAAAVPQVKADLALGVPGRGEKCLDSCMRPHPLGLAQRL